MIEGGGSKTLSKAKEWIFKHPKESHALLQRITDVCVDFLVGQAHAGAQVKDDPRAFFLFIFFRPTAKVRLCYSATYPRLLFSSLTLYLSANTDRGVAGFSQLLPLQRQILKDAPSFRVLGR